MTDETSWLRSGLKETINGNVNRKTVWMVVCFWFRSGGPHGSGYEPLLLEVKRDAVPSLLQFLKYRTDFNFFAGEPLKSLSTLSFSDNVDLQRSAALAFSEIIEKDGREVGRDTLEPIMFLLQSHNTEVQRAALGNLAANSLVLFLRV
ncbi:hypothetical protein CROQUDRAFT_352608 [Cronartium quercuum f. sp. fusiforme G11]|uniref:ARM repeat superfamily protein n=1 Tax=Cronartium quercuum f. sp. fusiforme G11 TaxID=708437 RepID=A0A9P6NND8_9BASI|nr:hypothetical protein CROQUDRAFT_352608 [Cronartium quercuum f. sp. fusiforme G11]